LLVVLTLVTVGVTLARHAGAAQEDLDVLKVIPQNYRLVLDNAFVRVIEARIPPGTEEKPHRHLRGVSVCMGDYIIEHMAQPGGPWVRSQRSAGDVYWSESSVHQTRNVGTTPSHTIRIELKF
jgi:hypothetical protein